MLHSIALEPLTKRSLAEGHRQQYLRPTLIVKNKVHAKVNPIV